MHKRKKRFLLALGSSLFVALVLFVFVYYLMLPTDDTPSSSTLIQNTTTYPIPISEITSSDQLDPTLHSQTKSLLQTPPYHTIIDKSADFSSVAIYLDGKHLSITDKPFKYKGRLYLPLRQVGEALGINIDFNNEFKVALAESDLYRLEMPLKYSKAIKIPLETPELASVLSIDPFNPDVSVVFYQEKTYLPVRFTAEALGYAVKYEEKENAVYFTSPK